MTRPSDDGKHWVSARVLATQIVNASIEAESVGGRGKYRVTGFKQSSKGVRWQGNPCEGHGAGHTCEYPKPPQPAGFEPARGDPIGFQVQRLNHSATTARMKIVL